MIAEICNYVLLYILHGLMFKTFVVTGRSIRCKPSLQIDLIWPNGDSSAGKIMVTNRLSIKHLTYRVGTQGSIKMHIGGEMFHKFGRLSKPFQQR